MLTMTRRRGKSFSRQAYPRAQRRGARELAAAVAAELEVELADELAASRRMRAGLDALIEGRAEYLNAMGIPDDPFDGEALVEYLAGD